MVFFEGLLSHPQSGDAFFTFLSFIGTVPIGDGALGGRYYG